MNKKMISKALILLISTGLICGCEGKSIFEQDNHCESNYLLSREDIEKLCKETTNQMEWEKGYDSVLGKYFIAAADARCKLEYLSNRQKC